MNDLDLLAKSHRYVRVQDGLHGMQCSDSGHLLLGCNQESTRNTVHFAFDGLVSDHAYGRFNVHPDGSLKGKVVIVANPDEMPTPAGLNQADTWFRMSAQTDESGGMTRQLDVGKATVIAPVGVDVPAGVDVRFYDGTLKGRDAAVAQVLSDQGVQQRAIGFRSWADCSEGDSLLWALAASKQLYPRSAGHIHVGMHDTSLDGELETVGISRKIDSLRQSDGPHFTNDLGVSTRHIDDIEATRLRHIEVMDRFAQKASPEDLVRCGKFYDRLRGKLDEDLQEAHRLSGLVSLRESVRLEKFCDIENKLSGLGPSKQFHIANGDGTGMEKLGTFELTERLVNRQVAPDCQVWIAGVSEGWQTMTHSPLRQVFSETAAPAPSMPPPLPPPSPPPLTPHVPSPPAAPIAELAAGMRSVMDVLLKSKGLDERPSASAGIRPR